MGKALSGGMFPISAVMADNDIMSVMTPGTHGSTFGGSPLACEVAMESVKVIIEEQLPNKSFEAGDYFRTKLKINQNKVDGLVDIRGMGLMNGLEFEDNNTMDKFIEKLLKNKSKVDLFPIESKEWSDFGKLSSFSKKG